MSTSEDWERVQRKLACATPDDLLRAAEAVVDAALYCKRFKCDQETSPERRSFLIEAVMKDPLLTKDLFR